ncbi:MAG: NAD-dependent epimerase/dehydratase family protein [Pseudomonadota bacterium]|nr:NAD-dependent epimerase/dehydratase family protein [Pseudomonadota bacterium]
MIESTAAISETNPIIKEDLERIVSADLPWNLLQDKSVLVTGGGFLTAYLIKSLLALNRLRQLNIQVICVVRSIQSIAVRFSDYLEEPGFSVFHHDISLPLPSHFPYADFVIHAASQASPKYYHVDPVGTLMANTIGTVNLLNHALKNQSERFMFFSSGEVYGIPVNAGHLVREEDYGYLDPMKVRSCYAESKRMGETMCVAWAHQYDLHASVVRPFHTYGPGIALDDGRVFADFVADAVARKDIVLKSDGWAQRPFCYIADATLGFLTVLLKGRKSEAYNVGNPDAEISVRGLAEVIVNLFPEYGMSTRIEVPAGSKAYLESPVSRSCPSIEKIKGLGWYPSTGIKDGFRRTIQSFL